MQGLDVLGTLELELDPGHRREQVVEAVPVVFVVQWHEEQVAALEGGQKYRGDIPRCRA